MGKSEVFGVSFCSKLLVLYLHNMPATRTHLVYYPISLCGGLGRDLTSAPIAKRISHEYGRYPDVAISLAFAGTIAYRGKGLDLYSESSYYTAI